MDALRLLGGGQLSAFSAKRPLFAAWLAAWLQLTGTDLKLALGLITGLTAIACYLATKEVQRTHGTPGAALFFSILFLFYRRFSGTTLTEHLGLLLGFASFTLLWRGSVTKRRLELLGGIFASSLAMNARAGAFFALPALVLWAAWLLRGEKRVNLLMLAYGFAAALVPFGINWLVFHFLAAPGGTLNANFSETLYGLVSGGQPWNLIYQEHPEVMDLGKAESAQRIYELALARFCEHPGLLLVGIFSAWKHYLLPGIGMFSFIRSAYYEAGVTWARIILMLLSLMAVCRFGWLGIRQRKMPPVTSRGNSDLDALAMLAFGGTLLSVPFAPPWDADYMRVYAAVMPFLAVLPVMGLACLTGWTVRRWKWMERLSRPHDYLPGNTGAVFSALVIILSILAPLLILEKSTPELPGKVNCPHNANPVYITKPAPGAYINVVDKKDLNLTWVPDVRYDNFIAGNNYDFSDSNVLAELERIPAGTSVFNSFDLVTGIEMMIAVPGDALRGQAAVVALCGELDQESGFFIAQRAK